MLRFHKVRDLLRSRGLSHVRDRVCMVSPHADRPAVSFEKHPERLIFRYKTKTFIYSRKRSLLVNMLLWRLLHSGNAAH